MLFDKMILKNGVQAMHLLKRKSLHTFTLH